MTRPRTPGTPRLIGLLCLFLAWLPGPAAAHAALLATSPPTGGLVAEAPQVAVLRFNEPVTALVLRLIGPDGRSHDLEAAAGAELAVALPALARGTQVLSWRVVSGDGHPVAGTLVFSVGEVTGAAGTDSAGNTAVQALVWASRAAMLCGLVLGLGGVLFGALAGLPARAPRLLAGLLVLGLGAAPLFLGLHGLDALGLPLAALATPAPWAAGWATSFGPLVALGMAGAVLGLAALRHPPLALPAVMLLVLGSSLGGHAANAAPQMLTRPLVALHVAMLTFWAGALLPLALWLRDPAGRAALARFSAVIPWAVALLAASGGALALVQFGPARLTDPAAWATAYGLILAAKLALVALLLALAAQGRWRLTRPALAADARARTRLRRTLRIEAALMVLILALAAGWRFAPPPRAMAETQSQALAAPAFVHLHGPQQMANLTATPGRAGPMTLEVQVLDAAMMPLEVLDVTLALALPERGLEPLTYAAAPAGDGLWLVDDASLPLPGAWDVVLELRLTRFTLARLGGTLEIE